MRVFGKEVRPRHVLVPGAVIVALGAGALTENVFQPVQHVKPVQNARLAWAEHQATQVGEDIATTADTIAGINDVARKPGKGKSVKYYAGEDKKGTVTLRVKPSKTEQGQGTNYTLQRIGDKAVVSVLEVPGEDGDAIETVRFKTPERELTIGGEQENATPDDIATVNAATEYARGLLEQFPANG